MRFHVDSTIGPAARGKRLKKLLQAGGYDVSLTDAYRLVARMMGFRDWRELAGSVGTVEPSPGDGFVDDAEIRRRRERHVRVLFEAGIELADAEAAVDRIGPTNYGWPRGSGGGGEADDARRGGVGLGLSSDR